LFVFTQVVPRQASGEVFTGLIYGLVINPYSYNFYFLFSSYRQPTHLFSFIPNKFNAQAVSPASGKVIDVVLQGQLLDSGHQRQKCEFHSLGGE